MRRRSIARAWVAGTLASLATLVAGCKPDLGPCDEQLARTLVYTDDPNGWPAYAGQALVESSCGGRSQQCHSSRAEGGVRLGAPLGTDFDLTVLNESTADGSTAALAAGQRSVYRLRYLVMREVERGSMPPGDVGSEFVRAHLDYAGLPSIRSAEGKAILRNWLACGAPVVERTVPTGSPPTVGAVVLAQPCPTEGSADCGSSTCADLTSDASNCGRCGEVCVDEPRTCTAGQCDCPTGRVRDATGACRDVLTDPSNCGRLGFACAPGAACVDGACTCTDAALTLCATGCVDLASDSRNCAGCDLACPVGASCIGATCLCGAGLTACLDGCVDVASDVRNCGACDRPCGAGEVCYGGTCLAGGCPQSTTECTGSCVDLATNTANCGACGNACSVAGSTCIGSACVCAPQSPPLTACANGCVDLASSESDCGACGRACGPGTVCTDGACVCATAGQTECPGGCTSLPSDPLNCGACGRVCPLDATCAGGVCACGTAGLTACGASCVDTTTDAANCGSCGRTCPTGQFCSGSQCTGVSFSRDLLPILTGTCAAVGCHAGRRPGGEMALTATAAYGSLVNVPSSQCTNPARLRVAPGAPDASYVMDKLLGVNLCQGNQMPKTGEYLPSQQLDLFRAWIAAGAPNN